MGMKKKKKKKSKFQSWQFSIIFDYKLLQWVQGFQALILAIFRGFLGLYSQKIGDSDNSLWLFFLQQTISSNIWKILGPLESKD